MKKIFAVVCSISLLFALASGCVAPNSDTETDPTATKTAGSGATATATAAAESTPADAAKGIHFDNIIVSSSSGMTSVNGEVKNEDTKAHSFTLKVSFYDADQKLLGTAIGAVNDLNGGETKLFAAIASEDYTAAANYKVEVDTMTSTKENQAAVIEFSNLTAKKVASMTSIDGEAKNTDTAAHSFMLSIGAYDSEGKLIGVATGAVNDLAAGDTKTFKAISSDDLSAAVTYKAFVGTMTK